MYTDEYGQAPTVYAPGHGMNGVDDLRCQRRYLMAATCLVAAMITSVPGRTVIVDLLSLAATTDVLSR